MRIIGGRDLRGLLVRSFFYFDNVWRSELVCWLRFELVFGLVCFVVRAVVILRSILKRRYLLS